MNGNKQLLNTQELIIKLKEKNIKFNYMSELQAMRYLENENNYYNVTAYRNNFERYYINGKFIDKYTNIDFAYLCDLSRIDYELSNLLFEMITNIERHLKLRILKLIEGKDNGYSIVNLYLDKDYNNQNYPKKLHKSIYSKKGSIYYKKIFEKYDIDKDKKLENIPIWEFLEIITFGELVDLYNFISLEHNFSEEQKLVFILRDVGRLRNAVYHNTSVLTDLNIKDSINPTLFEIKEFLKECKLGKDIRRNKIKNSRIRQITCTLFIFKVIVTDKKIQNKMNNKINRFIKKRITLHKEYYNNNELLKSTYEYFSKIIETNYRN